MMDNPEILIIGANLDPFDEQGSARNWWLNVIEDQFGDYDTITITNLAQSLKQDTYLDNYDILIVPSDQTDLEYRSLEDLLPSLVRHANNGGVVSLGVAGWGWRGGLRLFCHLKGLWCEVGRSCGSG